MNNLKLKLILKEGLKKSLNEYGGEQLNIPFDEQSSRATNYEQYIDFVKSITQPGTLTPTITNTQQLLSKCSNNDFFDTGINVYFYTGYVRDEFNDDEYEEQLNELEEEYGEEIYGSNNNQLAKDYNLFEELSEFGVQKMIEKMIDAGKGSIEHMANWLFKNSMNGLIPVNREIIIPKALGHYDVRKDVDDDLSDDYRNIGDFYSFLKYEWENLGQYWAHGTDSGVAYRGDNYHFSGGVSSVRIVGYTTIENIDFGNTCGVENVGEDEIFFKNGAKIMLTTLFFDEKPVKLGNRIYQV